LMSAQEAARAGYTPCPRCLGKYLRRWGRRSRSSGRQRHYGANI